MNILFIPAYEDAHTFARIPLFYNALKKRHNVFGVSSASPAFSRIAAFNNARQALKQNSIDLLFCAQPETAFIGAILAKSFKKPFVFDSHGSVKLFAESLKKNLFYKNLFLFFEKYSAKRAERTITVSETDKKELLAHGIGEERVFVLPTWIDLERIKNSGSEKPAGNIGFGSEKKHLLFFGSLAYAPNQTALKFIAEKLAPALQEKDCVLHVCGSGKPKIALKKNIVFHGFVEDIVSFINASDAVISPVWQGVGILEKVLLPMACGKPVIATGFALNGIPELKNNENALIARNEDDFVRKTMLAIDAESDLAKIGKKASALIKEKYSESNAKKLFEIIEGAKK